MSLLLVVGGVIPGIFTPTTNTTEVIDLSSKFKGCNVTADFPYPFGYMAGAR